MATAYPDPALEPAMVVPVVHQRRRPAWVVPGIVVVLLLVALWWAATQQSTVTRKSAEDSTLIPLVPPVPPPPPPPPPEELVKPEEVPEEVPPTPADQPAPTPETPQSATPSAPGNAVSIDGPAQAGGDAFNIGSGPGGGSRGSGRIGSGLGGFNRGAYAGYLTGAIRRLIAGRPRLRNAVLNTRARLWIDGGGRITRVEIDGGTDRAADLREALVGQTVRAPDASLAMPVALSIDFKRTG